MNRGIRKTRRFADLGIILTVTLLCTACQSIPTSGPVHTGLETLDQTNARVEFSAGGPVLGASEEEIVSGFIAAAASSANDYAIARQFLTREYASDWDPSLGVMVDEGTQSFEMDSGGVGHLTVNAVASIDESGVFRPQNSDTHASVRFELVQEDGNWRIASAPAGIILDKSTFVASWTPQLLYFMSFDGRLVAETRWYLDRSTLSTQVIGGLLQGPSQFLNAMSESSFPEGTRLSTGAVPIVNGIAQIELSGEVLNADAPTMERIKRQIGASLLGVPGINRFEILVNGSVIDTGSLIAAEKTTPTSQNQFVAVMRGDVFGPAAGAVGAQLPDLGETIADLEPTAVSLSPDRRSAAVLNQDGVSRVTMMHPYEVLVDSRPAQLHPGLDRTGTTWSYSTHDPQNILVTQPDGEAELLPLPDFQGVMPVSIRVSQCGSFIAALVPDATRPGGSRSLLAGIVRSADGVPIEISDAWATTGWFEGEPIDFDWIDEHRFMVLTDSGNSGNATQGTLGQFAADAGTVSEAVQLSGGGTRSLVRILDERGRLYAPQGSGWQRMQSDIDVVAKIG